MLSDWYCNKLIPLIGRLSDSVKCDASNPIHEACKLAATLDGCSMLYAQCLMPHVAVAITILPTYRAYVTGFTYCLSFWNAFSFSFSALVHTATKL